MSTLIAIFKALGGFKFLQATGLQVLKIFFSKKEGEEDISNRQVVKLFMFVFLICSCTVFVYEYNKKEESAKKYAILVQKHNKVQLQLDTLRIIHNGPYDFRKYPVQQSKKAKAQTIDDCKSVLTAGKADRWALMLYYNAKGYGYEEVEYYNIHAFMKFGVYMSGAKKGMGNVDIAIVQGYPIETFYDEYNQLKKGKEVEIITSELKDKDPQNYNLFHNIYGIKSSYYFPINYKGIPIGAINLDYCYHEIILNTEQKAVIRSKCGEIASDMSVDLIKRGFYSKPVDLNFFYGNVDTSYSEIALN